MISLLIWVSISIGNQPIMTLENLGENFEALWSNHFSDEYMLTLIRGFVIAQTKGCVKDAWICQSISK